MARVTESEVAAIYPGDCELTDFTTFIQTATLVVTEELGSSGLSKDRLTQIELYLAAHLTVISLEKGGLTRQKIGDSEDFYQLWTNLSTGFNATRFGQQAVMLDTTGTLQAIGSGKLKAQFRVVGKNPACDPLNWSGRGCD